MNLLGFAGESNFSRNALRAAYAEVESALLLISQTYWRSRTVLLSLAYGSLLRLQVQTWCSLCREHK